MVRILPMAASSSLHLSSLLHYSSPSDPIQRPPHPLSPPSRHRRIKTSKSTRMEGYNITACTGNMAQASTAVTEENALEWVKKDNRRMLHVVYRVGDLDKTIKFYTECLGMKLLRKRDIPEERYTNAFLGYGPEDSHFVVELTYNLGLINMTLELVSAISVLLLRMSTRQLIL
ncbi:putative lactoylglutathione lyase [Iris pallida]|uniref:Lactoylglutathione lyase n=1 Tax=Iris pallida TaxID=29817 RepID=A0AAX6DUY0_IRIPA|nr:putative lactoylglutathione lyase [Iris pallida]